MTQATSNSIQGKHYRFTLLTDQLIRLEFSKSGYFENGPTQTVLNRNLGPVHFHLIEDEQHLEIMTESFQLNYTKGAFSASNLFIDVNYQFSAYHNRWYYGSSIETLKGTARTLDMVDGTTPLEEGIISKNGFAVLDDSYSFLLDENQDPKPRQAEQIDLYFFAYGRDYKTALKDYYRLTGATPLLPRYALGNWWSRFWRYDEKEYLELMDRFKEEEIPLSVSVIDMDWHLTDIPKRFGSSWTGYTWNRELFPHPKAFLDNLHERGLKVTLNVHPADGIRAFEKPYPSVAKKLGLNQELEEPANFDIANEAFRASYFEDVHHPLEADGVDFWWLDWQQGTESGKQGLDPLWLLNHYHYQDIQRKKQNDIILSRYAGPGSHRYPIGFSGDTVISWDSLNFQPYFTSTAANIGYCWWSHDIGGHMDGYRDEELALRWLQFGVFSPINRLHSSNSPFTGKEPWRFNELIFSSMKKYLKLRHSLIPYLYTMNVLTSEEGLPLILPMYYEFPLEEEAYHVPNQYTFGTQMMVAPMTSKANSLLKASANNVWLPEGTWYDYFTGFRYQGQTKLKVFRTITEIPVFVKEGAIIPLDGDVKSTVGEDLPTLLEWHLFPGKNNQFTLIEQQKKRRVKTTLALDWTNQQIEIQSEGDVSLLPRHRKHKIVLRSMEKTDVIAVSNGTWEQIGSDEIGKTQSFLITPEEMTTVTIKMNKLSHIKKQNIIDLLYKLLDQAEIDYVLKDELWFQLTTLTDPMLGVSLLNQLEDRELADLLFEVLYIKRS